MDLYTFNGIGYSRWGDVGRYTSGEGQHNTTPMNEYVDYFVMPTEPARIVPGSPPCDAHQLGPLVQPTVPMVTPVSASTASTTTAGFTQRHRLTDDVRRQICEYHGSYPGVKQTEIGTIFGVERSTVSKILKRKEKFLNPNDGSQGPTKKAKDRFPDIERALANWANNEQIKGTPLNDSALQVQAQKFAITVGSPKGRPKLISSAWLENFKKKYNILGAKGHSNFYGSEGIHVFDSNSTSLLETPNSYTPVPSPSGELTPRQTSSNQTHGSDNTKRFLAISHFTVESGALVKSEGQDESTSRMPDRSAATTVSDSPVEESLTFIDPRRMTKRNESVPDVPPTSSTSMQPPLPRSENTSPVNSGSPTQNDARRALELVMRYFRSQPAGFLEPGEYAVVDKLMVKLPSSISE